MKKKIAFRPSEDYQGNAVKETVVNVLSRDGIIMEINDYMEPKRKIKSYKTPFTEEQIWNPPGLI